ncbi:MAG: hypothetical protein K2X66_14455, partial [Cyanobacteria bacterium]|nr:hypothetical protein [Cyanobacteriota bacterium]
FTKDHHSTEYFAALMTLFNKAKKSSNLEVWTEFLDSLKNICIREKSKADKEIETFTPVLNEKTLRSKVMGDFLSQNP